MTASGPRGSIPVACAALLACAFAATADDTIWREVDLENVVYMDLAEGRVTIELAPEFAPATATQFRKLVREGFYDGLAFYRVIDGFVAQAGDGSDLGLASGVATIEPEFELEWTEGPGFVPAQQNDLFAEETGFVNGFAAGREPAADKAWLLHCPGVIAMARGIEADSSRTDFYIVIGQAPRYLDRNMNIFGRVILGMEHVQRIRRGPPNNNGIIESDLGRSRIREMLVAADLPEAGRKFVYVEDTDSKPFASKLEARKNRRQSFFHHKPPAVLDACQVPIAARTTK